MTTRTVRPSSSYNLEIPVEAREDSDTTVSSYWIEGSPLLLQLSSYFRWEGKPPEAHTRLKERIFDNRVHDWRIWDETLRCDASIDQASAEYVDETGILWLHTYLVWPHLTIHASVSGPPELFQTEQNWAIRALESIRPTAH